MTGPLNVWARVDCQTYDLETFQVLRSAIIIFKRPSTSVRVFLPNGGEVKQEGHFRISGLVVLFSPKPIQAHQLRLGKGVNPCLSSASVSVLSSYSTTNVLVAVLSPAPATLDSRSHELLLNRSWCARSFPVMAVMVLPCLGETMTNSSSEVARLRE